MTDITSSSHNENPAHQAELASQDQRPATPKVNFHGRRLPQTLRPVDAGSTSRQSVSTYPQSGESHTTVSDRAETPEGQPVSIYPSDIFSEDADLGFSSGQSEIHDGQPREINLYTKVRARGRRRDGLSLNNFDRGGSAPKDVPDRSDEEILAQSEAVKETYRLARARALVELKPIVEHILNRSDAVSETPNKTIRTQTIAAQNKVALNLMRRFSSEQQIVTSIDEFPYVSFANWLIAFSRRVELRTIQRYKQYVVEYLIGIPGEEVTRALEILNTHSLFSLDAEDEQEDDVEEGDGAVESLTRRRQHIIKKFPIEDLTIMIRHLTFRTYSAHAMDLAHLINASIMTGLRPVEWRATTLSFQPDPSALYGRRVWLFVANAKTTNGRGNGLIRSIELTEYSNEGLKSVMATCDLAKRTVVDGTFDTEFRERFIKLTYRTTKAIWGDDATKGYSLYSCRHQASANWKAMMTSAEVAALSGHAMPLTTERWYGQRKSAWKKKYLKAIARPDPDEVQMILQRIAMARRFEKMAVDNLEVTEGLDPMETLPFLRS